MCVDPATIIAGIKTMTAAAGTTLGTIGTAATIGSGAISAYSAMQNARAQEAAAKRTAAAADRAALERLEEGRQQSDQQRLAAARQRSTNTALLAAQGVDVSGTQALDVLDDDAALAEQDAFAIRENARRGASGMAQSAANARATASSAKSAAFFKPVGTILSTAATVGEQYREWVVDDPVEGAFG